MKALHPLFLFLSLFLLCTGPAAAQNPSYHGLLRDAVVRADAVYGTDALRELSNVCQRILAVNDTARLPLYYRSYAQIHLAYGTSDEKEKDALLDQAQLSFDRLMALCPDWDEGILLDALIAYGRMEINPMARAPVNLARAGAALEKAKAQNPGNPRIPYLEGKSTLYKPPFLGGGPEAALPLLERALELYEKDAPPGSLLPHWGGDDARRLREECLRRIAG